MHCKNGSCNKRKDMTRSPYDTSLKFDIQKCVIVHILKVSWDPAWQSFSNGSSYCCDRNLLAMTCHVQIFTITGSRILPVSLIASEHKVLHNINNLSWLLLIKIILDKRNKFFISSKFYFLIEIQKVSLWQPYSLTEFVPLLDYRSGFQRKCAMHSNDLSTIRGHD